MTDGADADTAPGPSIEAARPDDLPQTLHENHALPHPATWSQDGTGHPSELLPESNCRAGVKAFLRGFKTVLEYNIRNLTKIDQAIQIVGSIAWNTTVIIRKSVLPIIPKLNSNPATWMINPLVFRTAEHYQKLYVV